MINTRRSMGTTIAQLLVFTLIGLVCITSSSINSARAATPAPAPGAADQLVGTWAGSGMTLTIKRLQKDPEDGDIFQGTLTQGSYSVEIKGIIDGHDNAVMFMRFKGTNGQTTDTFVNVVYSGYLSNATTLEGSWFIPPGPPSSHPAVGETGNFSLTKQ